MPFLDVVMLIDVRVMLPDEDSPDIVVVAAVVVVVVAVAFQRLGRAVMHQTIRQLQEQELSQIIHRMLELNYCS